MVKVLECVARGYGPWGGNDAQPLGKLKESKECPCVTFLCGGGHGGPGGSNLALWPGSILAAECARVRVRVHGWNGEEGWERWRKYQRGCGLGL